MQGPPQFQHHQPPVIVSVAPPLHHSSHHTTIHQHAPPSHGGPPTPHGRAPPHLGAHPHHHTPTCSTEPWRSTYSSWPSPSSSRCPSTPPYTNMLHRAMEVHLLLMAEPLLI